MIIFKNVQGSEESAKPLIYSKDTVYVHTNIRQEQDFWVYDEEQYTYQEWFIKKENESSNTMAQLIYSLVENEVI